jgi:peptidoglycan/xylan/chitin deacetylase (PgdA/CDA1 family)
VSRGAAVLLYHAVGAPGEPASRFVVPVRRLERQLRWLARRRYRVVALSELLTTDDVPRKTVALTFDDGYVDNLTLAFPLLERLGLPATVFAVSDRQENNWDRQGPLRGRPLLTPDRLRELAPLVAVGAHTCSHRSLEHLSAQELEDEVAGCRRELQDALKAPIALFAYPYGQFDEEARSAVEAAGFSGAVGVVSGRVHSDDDPYALPRLEIYGTFSFLRFLLTLWLGDTRLLTRWQARRSPRAVG